MRGRKYSNGVCYKHKGSFKLKRLVALILTLLMIFTSLPPMSVYAQIEASETAANISDQTLWTSSDPLLALAESPSAEAIAPVEASSPDVTITDETATPAPTETTLPEENTAATEETPVTDATAGVDETTSPEDTSTTGETSAPTEDTAVTGETSAPTEEPATEESTTPSDTTTPEDTVAPDETAITEEPAEPGATTVVEVVPVPQEIPLMTPMMEPMAVTPDAAETITIGMPYDITPFPGNSTQYYKFDITTAGAYQITYTILGGSPSQPVITSLHAVAVLIVTSGSTV
jgi:hypothetical protein